MKIVIALIAGLALSGCTTVAKLSTPTAQPYIQAAVSIAVAAAVGADPATEKAKALQIKGIAQQVLAVDEGSLVPLTQLQAIITSKIAMLNLPVGDVVAAQVLLSALSIAVAQEIQSLNNGAVTSNTQAAVAAVLNDIITATAAFGV